jgi:hypothetical protein
MVSGDILFEVATPLGSRVRVSHDYWELIVTVKHPVMRLREADVQGALRTPDEVRQSRYDPAVFLFYRLQQPGRWLCAIAKRLDDEGFLITTYPCEAIKEGERIWSK